MIVEDDSDAAFRRILGIEVAQQPNEFNTAVAILYARRDMTILEIQRRQDGASAESLVFVIAADFGMLAWYGRQIVSAGLKEQHFRRFCSRGSWPPLAGTRYATLHKILNSAWRHRGAGVTIELAPTGRVLADGAPFVRGVLDAGPRHSARLSSVRLHQSPTHPA